ncbi:MAG: HEAT repeat domain-containing protein [Chloroflexi bacterium]|nr:MAG: HEAT repeat domain-containing protein [Chloroflexota bacterium]
MYALSELAYSMHDDELVGFGNETGWETARNILKHCITGTPYTVEDVLEEAVASSLLVTRFRKRIEFVHQLVQEFFVAFYLNNMINNSSFDSPLASITTILGESLMHKDMNEIIIMLIGISDSQMLIAEWLANQIIEKRHKSSISLLKRCIEIVYETTDADVSKEFVDILLGSMRDPDIHIRWDTVVILGEIKNANALEPLIIDLLEPSRFSRQKIRKVIERSKHPPRNKLIALLKHPNSLVRRNTIEILERINDDWVIEPIVSVLKDNDPNVRWQAVYTLGKIGNKRVLKELENIAVKDDTVAHSKFRIANTALEAIWKIQNRLDKRTFEI